LRKETSRRKISLLMSRSEKVRAFVAAWLLSAFLLALGLAVSPQLHERVHPDSGSAQHECAVTLISAGQAEQASLPVILWLPEPVQVFETIPAVHPVWVEPPFLGGCIFEHAPPALS
jgi:hypothetical protein